MRRRIITYSLLLLILVVAFPLLLITQEAESEGGGAGRTFEEEVKGKFKGKIEEVKPEIVLEYDIFEIIESYAGEKGFIYDKELIRNSDIASTPLPTLASDQLYHPWLTGINRGEIAIFHPLYGHDVAEWELTITNAGGDIFKTFSSEGKPDKRLFWDGRGEGDKMIDVGATYSYYATAVDKLGNRSRVMGKEIKVQGILYKEHLDWIIRLDGREMFEPGKADIRSSAMNLLTEAADIVRKQFIRRISVKAYSTDDVLSQTRANNIAKVLSEKIILPKGVVIHTAGYAVVGKVRTDRVDIIVR
ncbi:MAG: hypothetical protein E3J78_03915 [Candidatus Cloacimonadota bacterium]|nr:MAG: hypothetical protein E3J78_03915 [Candidatus Cloacimonadota bacterium]